MIGNRDYRFYTDNYLFGLLHENSVQKGSLILICGELISGSFEESYNSGK